MRDDSDEQQLEQLEFADLRERLYPLLMDLVQIHAKSEGEAIVQAELADGLHVIYCVEEDGDKIRYVTYQDLRHFGVSPNTLHVTAIRNLEAKTAKVRVAKLDTAEGGRPMFIWHIEDGFDAARILLAQWLDDFAAAVPGRLVLGVPHRNWLVAFGDGDANLLAMVRKRIQTEHKDADFPVSPYLYTWTGATLERYTV
jgi:uncharacterized protein YtpQ (UPF0354 family)